MKKILIFLLIISLILLEGCATIAGHKVENGINKEDLLEIEEIESTEENNWLTITLKNNEVIKGQFISCTNDTLFVTYQSITNFTPISENQFLSISPNKIFYKIPVDQIKDIQIRKVDLGVIGAILGLIIDVSMLIVIKMSISGFGGLGWNS